MKYVFTLLFCLFASIGFAETIGDVEYNLPSVAKDWEVVKKLETDKGDTLIYAPKGAVTREFFGVNSNKLLKDVQDISAMKTVLSNLLPNMEITLTEIGKDKDSATYEWYGKENGTEKIHGWGRIFAEKDGTVLLSYQTENTSDVSKERSIWLPVLKGAHLKK